MNCDIIYNRILALPTANELTADVRDHVDECTACRAVLNKALQLDRVLAQLPAPSSELARVTFLEQFLAEGPIIRNKPVVPSSVGSSNFPVVGKILKIATPKMLAGLAAGVIVAIGGVWFVTRPKPAQIEHELAEKPKHELLARSVKHHVELSKSHTAPERLAIFTKWSADMTAEAKDVFKAANRDEISKIAALYEDAVSQGIIEQAKKLEDHPMNKLERLDRLQSTMNLLNTTAAETISLAAQAPPDAQVALKRMASAAKNAHSELLILIKQRGA